MQLKPVVISISLLMNSSVFAAEWGYEAGSINHWHELEGAEICAVGKRQSPINIETSHVKKQVSPNIKFDYSPSSVTMVNTGKTVQVNVPSQAGRVLKGDQAFKLLQFHFHTPSEEAVNGRHYPLVAHFVHQADDGKLLVVALLFETGMHNPDFENIFKNMNMATNSKGLEVEFDAKKLFEAKHSYYHFEGSLTTPPCSEGVDWYVIKQPIEISAQQLEAFKRLYPNNARPIQELNGRQINEMD